MAPRHAWPGALLVLLIPQLLLAAPTVLEPGRERDVLALVAPFEDGAEVSSGVFLAGIRIRSDRVDVLLAHGPSVVRTAILSLRLREPMLARASGKSFDLVRPARSTAAMNAAVEALAATIRANDDGHFMALPEASTTGSLARPNVAQADRHPRVALAEIDPDFDLWRQPETALAVALWLLLVAALTARIFGAVLRARSPHRRPLLTTHLMLLMLAGAIALFARQAVPFTPLHANHNAFDDLAVTLDLADAGPSTQRAMRAYGPSWLVAQRAATPLFGAHHDGIGAAACWWGALAVTLALAAAWGAGAAGWPAVMAAMAMALAPVAVRVGHSESTLVIGQWLIATTLLLASRRTLLCTLGALAGLLLLSTGHVVGPALAGGTALLAWAMPPPNLATAATPPAGGSSASARSDLPRLGIFLTAPLIGGLLHLHANAGEVAYRVAATERWLPLPVEPASFSLWFDPEQAPLGLLALVGLGVLGLALHRGALLHWRGRALVAGAVVGVLCLWLGGLLVCASVSDGLRYQSTLAPALVVLGGQAGHLTRRTADLTRFGGHVALALAGVLTLLPLTSPLPGLTRLDAQAQWYGHLRQTLADKTGPVYLLIADRGGHRGAVFQAPQGRLSAAGAVAHEVREHSLRFECEAGIAPRQPLYVLFPPACASGADDAAAHACATLEPYVDHDRPMATGLAWPLRSSARLAIAGEFLKFRHAVAPWRLARGRCPDTSGGPP